MQVTYACPHCAASQCAEVVTGAIEMVCSACGQRLAIPDGAWADGEVRRCLVCPSHDLFIRKDFPQRWGVAIVVAGFAASSVAWHYYYTMLTFGILFAVALADVVLFLFVGNSLMCYRCAAEYRGLAGTERHGPFELETHEKHRQQQARLAERGVRPRTEAPSAPSR